MTHNMEKYDMFRHANQVAGGKVGKSESIG